MTSRKSSGSIPVESAVDPTRSQNITVSWRRSASGAAATAAGATGRTGRRPEIALDRWGKRLLGMPQGRQWLRQRHRLGSGRASLGRPDQKLAVDIGRDALDDDQLATEFFETVVIETEAELDPAIGDAALGDEAPEDLFQDPLKVHAFAPVRRDLRPCFPDGRYRA